MQSATVASSPDVPVLDLDHLNRVTFSDRAFRDELLALFAREARLLGDRLADASLPADWKLAAHTMKGMARGVGAARLAVVAAEAEYIAPEELAARRQAALSRLAAVVLEAVAAADGLRTGEAGPR